MSTDGHQTVPDTLDLGQGCCKVEAMAQLGGIVMMDPEKEAAEQQNFFFGGIEGCKFRRPVVPGDTLVSTSQHRTLNLNPLYFFTQRSHLVRSLIPIVPQVSPIQLQKPRCSATKS